MTDIVSEDNEIDESHQSITNSNKNEKFQNQQIILITVLITGFTASKTTKKEEPFLAR